MDIDLREANEAFHDCESVRYDKKWGITFDKSASERVKHKFEKLLGRPFPHTGRLLEVGCGTGFASLNLGLCDGLIDEINGCDISSGMVQTYLENARSLGLDVKAKRSELEKLDYADDSFDMVIGHAILHHIPDVKKALSEINRVLVPGGICMIAGEPTRTGDSLGRMARTATFLALQLYSKAGGRFGGTVAKLRSNDNGLPGDEAAKYEGVVDVHTFRPRDVLKIAVEAGFVDVRYESEELVSSFTGWIMRTIDNNLVEENLTDNWHLWCYNTFLKLSAFDEAIYPYLPSSLFYNMLLFCRKGR